MTPTQQALAADHMAIATSMVNRYASRRNPLRDELLGEARLALCRAAIKFNPDHGASFSTYAHRSVIHAIWNFVDRWNKVDLVVFSVLSKIDKHSYQPTKPNQSTNPNRQFEKEELREQVGIVKRSLPPRWWAILEMRYLKQMLPKEIADELGLSRSRVQQLIDEALIKIRRLININDYDNGK